MGMILATFVCGMSASAHIAGGNAFLTASYLHLN